MGIESEQIEIKEAGQGESFILRPEIMGIESLLCLLSFVIVFCSFILRPEIMGIESLILFLFL